MTISPINCNLYFYHSIFQMNLFYCGLYAYWRIGWHIRPISRRCNSHALYWKSDTCGIKRQQMPLCHLNTKNKSSHFRHDFSKFVNGRIINALRKHKSHQFFRQGKQHIQGYIDNALFLTPCIRQQAGTQRPFGHVLLPVDLKTFGVHCYSCLAL